MSCTHRTESEPPAAKENNKREGGAHGPHEDSESTLWMERIVIFSLFCGYLGREFCTLHLYTVSKLWQADSHVDDKTYSFMLGVGHVTGASAKVGFGILAGRLLKGRAVFLVAALGGAAFTLLFGVVATQAEYFIVWLLMHLFLPGCWVGLVGIVAENVAAKRVGQTMALLSLTYVGGDACVRAMNSSLLKIDGFGWRGIFLFGGTVGIVSLLPIFFFVKPSPRNSDQATGSEASSCRPQASGPASEAKIGHSGAVRDLLCNPAFGLVCLLSFTLRAVRSFFMSFTVPFLVEVSCRASEGSDDGVAACLSSVDANSRAVLGSVLFPLTGVVSTVLCGHLKDRMGLRHRAWIPIVFLSFSLLALSQLALLGAHASWSVALASLVACGFGLFGPYTLLAGAFAIDVGGPGGAATASAIIDSTGTLGAVSVVALKGGLGSDWVSIFCSLLLAVAVAVAVSLRLLVIDRRNHPAQDSLLLKGEKQS